MVHSGQNLNNSIPVRFFGQNLPFKIISQIILPLKMFSLHFFCINFAPWEVFAQNITGLVQPTNHIQLVRVFAPVLARFLQRAKFVRFSLLGSGATSKYILHRTQRRLLSRIWGQSSTRKTFRLRPRAIFYFGLLFPKFENLHPKTKICTHISIIRMFDGVPFYNHILPLSEAEEASDEVSNST